MPQSPEDVSREVPAHADDVERLKHDYESRRADQRPMSHSVAVAYRQLIARGEAQRREQGKQS